MSLLQLKNNFNLMNKEFPHKIIQTEPLISSHRSKDKYKFNDNTNSSYNKIKNKNHIIIDSKKNDTKKVPNLMKNVQHRPKIAISCDEFRYQPLSSLEKKISKQLGRISNKYTEIKNRKFFNNGDTDLYWQNFPDYEIYRQLKELETRKETPYGFRKPRLQPLIYNKKDKLGKLAQNLYEADQVERFKNLLYKYKINRRKADQ